MEHEGNKLIVCEPDILSFNIDDHKMQFAVLASDGLWDTHTNEDAVSVISTRSQPSITNIFWIFYGKCCRYKKDSLFGTEVLAREAYTRGSLDNITVLVIDFTKVAEKNK